jgi:hypothetical protein
LHEDSPDALMRFQRVTPEELIEIPGIVSVKAGILIAALELVERIYNR